MITGHKHLDLVSAYTPGASVEDVMLNYGLVNVEKLSSNENPFGPSPRGKAAAILALDKGNLYPDSGLGLRLALARHHNVSVDSVTVNNGSDAIIHQVMHTFLLPGETALSSHGGFVSFGIAVHRCGNEPQYTPLTSDYRFDVEAIVDAINSTTKIIYIPNPNNPTGTYLTTDEIDWMLERVPDNILVVMDEAYTEYATHLRPHDYPNSISFGKENVLSLRTFSKAYGLAALRVGYAVGHPDVVRLLLKTKLPFDPSGPASAAATAAIDDIEFVQNTVETNAAGLSLLLSTLREYGYTCSSSVANFVMIDCGDDDSATRFHRSMLERGFISRPLRGFGLPTCVRISTGTPEQNLRLAESLKVLADVFVTP